MPQAVLRIARAFLLGPVAARPLVCSRGWAARIGEHNFPACCLLALSLKAFGALVAKPLVAFI
eukprot:2538177-Pyramimonas_sp.AAC.1